MDIQKHIEILEKAQDSLKEIHSGIKNNEFSLLKKKEIDDLDTASFIVATHLEDTINYLKKVTLCQEE